ncbi:MAG: N-acetyl-alpha-D-glucosaminyl L-malate synthase BshA [Blastocatellia bacterium]|nr:N-acetyl-alpha-D-glucosaminyl L-malate synthase BshA [Blastocatellia bacterium]
MNIGITCYATYGGSGIVGSELGMELAKRGHTIHFISSALPTRITELSDNVQFHEVEVANYPLFDHPPYTLALAVKMAEVAREKKLDVLHVHYAIPHSVSAFLAREMSTDLKHIPFITTLHGTDITLVGADRSYLPITRFGILQSDGVTAVSAYLKAATCEVFDVSEDVIEVIPNFISPNVYQRRPQECVLGKCAPDNEKILLHISNFRAVKRVTDCIRIFARLQGKIKARLVMVGDGPEKSQAEWLARQLGVHKNVLFVGKQPNIPAYLSIADVLLLPSETESFGLSALEAMACEVPVVASHVGGLPEVVSDGETGYLADVGDVEAMAKYALKILSSESLRKKMGQAARQAAVERFSTDAMIPLYEAYYRRVIEKTAERHRAAVG